MRWKSVLGVGLMAASLALLIFWETEGRRTFTLSPVLVAARDMEAGTLIGSEDLQVVRLPAEHLLEGSQGPDQVQVFLGRRTRQPLRRQQQLTDLSLQAEGGDTESICSVFPLKESWIGYMSSVIRPGDQVTLYSLALEASLGSYKVAYAVDGAGKFLLDVRGGRDNLMDRPALSAAAAGLEIICRPEDYLDLLALLAECSDGDLIVWGEGER